MEIFPDFFAYWIPLVFGNFQVSQESHSFLTDSIDWFLGEELINGININVLKGCKINACTWFVQTLLFCFLFTTVYDDFIFSVKPILSIWHPSGAIQTEHSHWRLLLLEVVASFHIAWCHLFHWVLLTFLRFLCKVRTLRVRVVWINILNEVASLS